MPRATAGRAALLFAALLAGPAAALEKPPELRGAPEAAKPVGATTFRVLFWRVFDASLWSGDGAFDWSAPFALSLTYGRDFTADALKRKTVEEMARLSGAAESSFGAFGAAFEACIDDVGEGDRITAVSVAENRARLYLNGQKRCELERPRLRRDFFGIWLSADSQFPEATARLVGASGR